MFRSSDHLGTLSYGPTRERVHCTSDNFSTITPIQRNCMTGFQPPISSQSSIGCSTPSTSLPNISGPSRPIYMWNVRTKLESFDLSKQEGNYGLPDDLVEDVVNFYFDNLHPWIPRLHREEFKAQLSDIGQLQRIAMHLHAIVALCVRFSNNSRLSDPEVRSGCSRWNRQIVILKSSKSCTLKHCRF